MPLPLDLDELSATALKELVVRLLGEVAELKQTVTGLRAEIARLKGLKGRPRSNPAAWTRPPNRQSLCQREARRRGKVRPRVSIEDHVLPVAAPAGSRFKGYESYLVQDLVLSVHAIRYCVNAG